MFSHPDAVTIGILPNFNKISTSSNMHVGVVNFVNRQNFNTHLRILRIGSYALVIDYSFDLSG